MEQKGNTGVTGRRMAAVFGLSMPGLGQIYNGELVKGASIFIIFLMAFVAGLRLSVLLPDRWLLAGVIGTAVTVLIVYGIAIIDAWRQAGIPSSKDRAAACRRWYFFLAVWMLESVLFVGITIDYAKSNIVEAYKIVSTSMAPTVLQGDRILVDKTAYERMPPQIGDIVVFVYPDDRSKVFIKKIAALPGEILIDSEGREVTVPHGAVYVLGNDLQHSIDSRQFGFVPLSDLNGKARVVYYSSAEDGVRRGRIGTVLD